MCTCGPGPFAFPRLSSALTLARASPMTTYSFHKVTCSVCGATSEQKFITSTNSVGAPDLDLRPAEMERSTMYCWLQECLNCGFVSDDLRKSEKGAKEVLSTPRYRDILLGSQSHAFLRRCLKRSLLDECLPNMSAAAERALWAAWAADDADDPMAASLRSKAADLFLTASSTLPANSIEPITMRARAVDILRRAGRCDEAVELADQIFSKADMDPMILNGRRIRASVGPVWRAVHAHDPGCDFGITAVRRVRLTIFTRVFEIKPDFSARAELAKWKAPRHDFDHLMEGLRKAGLEE